jgi:peptidyl-dipeptidase Dcp
MLPIASLKPTPRDARLSPENPLLSPWTGPFGAPPFGSIRPEHFRPAFDAAIAGNLAEIAAIKADPEPPGFDNTILALERSGRALDRVARVFFHLAGADSNDEIEAIEREIAPKLARARSAILLDDELFRRVDAVHAGLATSGLDSEARRLVDRHHLAFTRAGAGLAADKKARLAEIGERLAALGATFGQNVLADERAYLLVLEIPDALAGLPPEFLASAARTAAERGHPGKHAVTLSRSSIEPFLQFSARRDLREKAFRAFLARGANGGAHDNGAVMSEMVRLRAEKARLLGYPTYAEHRLADTMAKTPTAALELMRQVWAPARAAALREGEALQAMIVEEGGNFELKPWDWRYYAEKRREALYDFDEGAVKAHLPLENLIAAAFEVAWRLFGLEFAERRDIDLPHPDARAWNVSDSRGAPVALFIGDYFARSSKHSGAWMSAWRDQSRLDAETLPIVSNVMNFARGAEGEACLLSHEEARTLFHEFGHALHGMLSDVTYPTLSGTRVARDFVEFPSQVYEHWLDRPEVLDLFAKHHETGAPMPAALREGLRASQTYGQAFATVEFSASAFVDMALHSLSDPGEIDVEAFQAEQLAQIGMPEAIAVRHGVPHFQHIFSGEGYSAGYYSYLWSAVLDSDGFEAFEEAGDVFDPALAARLKQNVYAAGNKRTPEEAYAAFRGRAPKAEALLRKRGFGI